MKRPGQRRRGRLGAALGAVLGLLAPQGRAEEPARVTCTATRTGTRVVVRPEALSLVAPELERLMKLGLAGRLEVELRLSRPRPWWLAEQVDTAKLTLVLAYSVKTKTWLLDGSPLEEGLGRLELERVAWTLDEEPGPEATFVVEVGVRLQVVTTASLLSFARSASLLSSKDPCRILSWRRASRSTSARQYPGSGSKRGVLASSSPHS